MIVISGALVLVALVLLVIGLVSTSLPFVYASIAVSVVSFAFLLVGILQRRGEKTPDSGTDAAETAPRPAAETDEVTTVIPAARRAPVTAPAPAADDAPAAASGGRVLIVAGRPRYHVAGCRYLTGKNPDEVDAQAARADGFTACGVCKPDDARSEDAAPQPQTRPEPEPEPAAQTDSDSAAPAVAVQAAPVVTPDPVVAARRTTKAAPAKAPGRTPAKTASRVTPRPVAPAAPAQPAKRTAAAAPTKTTRAPASKAPAKTAPAAKAPAGRRGMVVVIPDRGKYHEADCRYVRGADDAEEVTRAQATRQGYEACGVCKP